MTDPDQRLKLGLAHVTYQGAEPTLFHKVLVRLRRASAAGFPVGKRETVFPAWEKVSYVSIFFIWGKIYRPQLGCDCGQRPIS